MGLLVSKEDFTGKYALAVSPDDQLDAYIEQYEEELLRHMLGNELYDLFKADIDPTTSKPLTDIYLALYDPVRTDCGNSLGLKRTVLGFIYFYYVRDLRIKVTANGPIVNQTETSVADFPMNYLYERYNEAVESYNIIRRYAHDHSEDYPTLKGRPKRISSWV